MDPSPLLQLAPHFFLSTDLSTVVPVLGPLLAKPHIEWWLLAVILLFGIPAKETEYETETDERGRILHDADGRVVKRAVHRWRSRGLVAAIWVGATGHARLADRVGALEAGVETVTQGLSSVVAELRAWRTSLEASGLVPAAKRADGSTLTPPASEESVVQSRRPMASRP